MRRPFCTNSSFNALSSSRPPSMICNFSGLHKSICFFAQTLTDLGRLVHSPCIISIWGASWVACLRLLFLDENLWKNGEEYKKIATQILLYLVQLDFLIDMKYLHCGSCVRSYGKIVYNRHDGNLCKFYQIQLRTKMLNAKFFSMLMRFWLSII